MSEKRKRQNDEGWREGEGRREGGCSGREERRAVGVVGPSKARQKEEEEEERHRGRKGDVAVTSQCY